eukprot:scaffold1503_cov120-Isochrysis_galbana.AAC.4
MWHTALKARAVHAPAPGHTPAIPPWGRSAPAPAGGCGRCCSTALASCSLSCATCSSRAAATAW